jgi:hypothetical protein
MSESEITKPWFQLQKLAEKKCLFEQQEAQKDKALTNQSSSPTSIVCNSETSAVSASGAASDETHTITNVTCCAGD